MSWKAGARPGRVSGWLRSLDRLPGPERATKSKQSRGEGEWERLGAGNLLLVTWKTIVCSPRSVRFPWGQEALSPGAWEGGPEGTGNLGDKETQIHT